MSTIIQRSVRSWLTPLFLPLPQNLPSSHWPSQMPSLFLKFQRDLAQLVAKARGLKGRKARAKTRERSPLPRPKMQLRQRKQRPRLKKMIPRPRMLLLPSQARRKILLLKLSPQDPFFDSFLQQFIFFFNDIMSMCSMYFLYHLMRMFFISSFVLLPYVI